MVDSYCRGEPLGKHDHAARMTSGATSAILIVMLNWLIIGGGVHGCTIAHSLLTYARAPRAGLRVVDPHAEPLDEWHRTTHSCGMRFLRSPAAHAIVPDFTALLGWAKQNGFERDSHTIPPYARPSLELFNAHAHSMIERSGLRELWHQATAVRVGRREGDGSRRVTLEDGSSLRARNIVLALGRAGGLNLPEWAPGASGRVVHVFAPTFDRAEAERARHPVVIGGGVTGVHLALHLADRGRRVRLIVRAPIRVKQFDSDPCFIGPACMKGYLAIDDPNERRRVLATVRNPGSVPSELAEQLDAAVAGGSIELVIDEIESTRPIEDKRVVLHGNRDAYESDFVAPATGYARNPPGGAIRESLADGSATGSPLPEDAEGYALPRSSLEWADGLYVTGSFAEQELGPAAPNIIGAHLASKRIVAHLSGRVRLVPSAWRRYAPASVSSSSTSF
ncbi:MAG: FAD/NAD(P)-binding protein [Spirochaetota bacterium]